MAVLFTKVKKYLEANSKTWDAEKDNIVLQNDGSGDYIQTWNVSGLAEPTAEQIASYDTAADDEEYNNSQIDKRIVEYGPWKDQLDEIYTDIDAWKTRIAGIKTKYPKR